MKTLSQIKEGDKVWNNLMYLDEDWTIVDHECIVTKLSTWREYDDVVDEMRQMYVFEVLDQQGQRFEYISKDDVGIYNISENRNIFFDNESLEDYKMWLLKATIHDLEHKRIALDTALSNSVVELKRHLKHE